MGALFKNFFILVRREFTRFVKNRTLLSVFILAPIIYAVLLAFVYKEGKVTELNIIVVDKDNTPMSSQVIEMLNDNEGLSVKKTLYESVDMQKEFIRLNAAALIVIPDRFEADILQARYPEVLIYCNTTNMLTANFASKSIQQSLGTFAVGAEVKALQRRGMSASQAMTKYEPFKQNYLKVYNETGNYFTFMWPAMLAVVLQQVILLAMAVSFAVEFEKGTFATEFLSHTRSAFGAVLVKVIPSWIFSVLIILLFYGFHVLFKAPLPQHFINFAIISGLFILAVSFLGTMVSMIIPDALKATQVLMVIASPSFIIGGYTWPLEAMPFIVRALADIIPLTPFLNAFKILLIQGGDLSDVRPYLWHMLIQVLVYGLLSVVFVKLKIRKELKKLHSGNVGVQ